MNKEQLRHELDATLSQFYHLFSAIPGDVVNVAPFEGSWTPAQLARHLVLANGGCLEDINGPVQDTDRPLDAGVENIRSVFLDFSTKMESPPSFCHLPWRTIRSACSFRSARSTQDCLMQ
jgi:hypothetical protein